MGRVQLILSRCKYPLICSEAWKTDLQFSLSLLASKLPGIVLMGYEDLLQNFTSVIEHKALRNMKV